MSGIICTVCEHRNPQLAAYCASCEMPLNEPPAATPSLLRIPIGETPPPPPRAIDIVKARLRIKTAAFLKAQTPIQQTKPKLKQATHFPTEWRIFLAWSIDAGILLSVGLIVTLGEIYFSQNTSTEISNGVANWLFIHLHPTIHGLVAIIVTGCFYETLIGRGRGLTIGRLLSGIRLKGRKTGQLSRLRILIRSGLGCLSALCFGAGFFWALVDSHGRTWHDLLCGTTLRRSASISAESSK